MDQPELVTAQHPLAEHLLGELRDTSTPPERFRTLAQRLTSVLVLEATRGLSTRPVTVTSPVTEAQAHRIDTTVVAIPILRAGLGMLTAVTDLLPDVQVGYVGLERDEETLQPSSYYLKVPSLEGAAVLLLDPMLATGGSAAFAAELLKQEGAQSISLVCVVAAPEGIARLHSEHPDVRVITASVDDGLNEVGYIVPGLGDFGDRLFGTD